MSKFIFKLLFLFSCTIHIGKTYSFETPDPDHSDASADTVAPPKPPKKNYTTRYKAQKAAELEKQRLATEFAEQEQLLAPIKARLAIAQVTNIRRMLFQAPAFYHEDYIVIEGPDGPSVILPKPQELHEYRDETEHTKIIKIYKRLDSDIVRDVHAGKLPLLNKADYDAYRDRLYRKRDLLFDGTRIPKHARSVRDRDKSYFSENSDSDE